MNDAVASPAALREAALAVVAHLHGLRVNELRLEPPESGHELLDTLRYGLDLERLDMERQFIPALKRAEVALAGGLAVECYLDARAEAGEAEAIAGAILERLCDSERQQETLHAFVRCRLLDLLDAPVNRAMIEELATQLDAEGALDRDQFMLVTLRTVKLPL
jgi:hypothetical protein